LSKTKAANLHQFVVFSVIDNDGNVIPKFAQCNNCGVVHSVFEIGRSKILSGKESMASMMTLDDIRSSLPDKLVNILQKNNVDDLPTWEEAKFILENKRWGEFIVLSKDKQDGILNFKLLKFVSDNIFVVENETRNNFI
jgi:hypothetical protein